ncbi:TetR/AcrR family transcriptional regulator C-terminal domain-containing protein [Microbacterium sp. p3-SID338]|uniref:TetR/AcrR family transcriptional regulator C-terminal domain-containing protein n=1 Tax=unclassified Microbacterium TaxID=2609290 RepID=UPI000C7F8482|nr:MULTISPECIES: TetR/AcrR family transcriptional regulator C-terminal domain-containing protein [unclassified Microbacterium]MCT1396245.1 TetR/AcrR family transcriptional regulator C-terminal domain-containing protein [Microbacterium sp. p3-SID338]PMC02329.1 TetR family transcriptional regulator [Microbacterium sp. UMB0228]
MTKNLVDLLWRHSPVAPATPQRGPKARHSTDDVVDRAVALADADGLAAVTIRSLAQSLELTPMSIYTHVNSRADLLVLMADAMHARMLVASVQASGWRDGVRAIAEDNLRLFRTHPWLIDVRDPRVALGPGTIGKYDRELHAFDGLGLGAVERDAALSFVLDFTLSAAARMREQQSAESFAASWAEAAPRLAVYLGDDLPLARSVGQAAGESMGGPYDARTAWEFGLARVIDGLAAT